MKRSLEWSLGKQAGAAPLPTIAALSAYSEPEIETYSTALGGLTAPEKFAFNRFAKYLKAKGMSRLFGSANCWLSLIMGTEAKFMVDVFNPARSLTKVGAPTFAALDGVSTGSVSNYYDTPIQANQISQNGAAIGGYCCTFNAGAANGYDMGDTASMRTMRRSTADLVAAAVNGTAGALGASTDWGTPEGVVSAWRNASGQYKAGLHGQPRVTVTNASAAPSGSTTISFLFMKGGTTWSRQKWAAFFVLDGVSDDEMAYFAAALKVLVDGLRYGLPNVQPAGYGDAAVNVDLLVEGTSMSAICAAYAHKREFPAQTVAIVCDPLTESVEQLGGMPVCGLNWTDITVSTSAASGLFYEMIRQVKIRISGTASTSTQQGTSVNSRDLNVQVRRMLDVLRSTGSLPGADIPIYLSTGIRGMTKNGKVGGTLTTNDGRVFTFKRIAAEGYDGDVIYHLGLPFTTGREAVGTGKENLNGWKLTQVAKPNDNSSNPYNIDPYVSSGVPASGLLPDIIAMPAYTIGQAYPSNQSMNFRQNVVNTTTNKDRRANFVGGPSYAQPANYVALRYEAMLRGLAAMTAAAHAQAREDIYTFTRSITDGSNGAVIDLNSRSFLSSDLGNSGDRYIACGQDLAARKAVVTDLVDYTRGYNYTIISSGDGRIESGLNANFATNFSYDATQHLDWVTWKPLYFPGLPYRREPIYMLNNAASGGVVLDSNDGIQSDGQVPNKGANIISSIMYGFDYHSAKWVAYDAGDGAGTVIHNQGGFNDSSQGNTNVRTPWPWEVSMPVKADCQIMMTSVAPSMTKPMYAAARMEPQMCIAAQLVGITLGQSIADDVAVQDVTYATVRAKALASPDSVQPLITTTT